MVELIEEVKKKKKEDAFFIDRWCAKNVRKVSYCEECLHYKECKAKGESVSPRAKARYEK